MNDCTAIVNLNTRVLDSVKFGGVHLNRAEQSSMSPKGTGYWWLTKSWKPKHDEARHGSSPLIQFLIPKSCGYLLLGG